MVPQKVEVCYCNIKIQYNCSQANRFIDIKKNKAAKLFETAVRKSV